MNEELEKHEIYVDIVNELVADDTHYITSVATVQTDDGDGINSIQIRLAQREAEEDEEYGE